jgi:farnesyl diphosphate synthase
MLIDQAIAHLAAFGAEADMLRAIAHFTIQRDH